MKNNENKDWIDIKELSLVCKQLDKKKDAEDFVSVRNAFLFKLLAYSGIEVKELISLRGEDIIFNDHQIMISISKTKIREERIVVLPFHLIKDNMTKYLKLRTPGATRLFYSDLRGIKTINKDLVTKIVKDILTENKARVKDKTPRMLRRSYAINLNNEKSKLTGLTMPESAIQVLMGTKNRTDLRNLLKIDRNEFFNPAEYF